MGDSHDLNATILARLNGAVPELLDVLLFGSRARGDHRSDSDVDLVLILPDGADRTDVLLRARKSLRHLGVGFDLLLLTQGQWAQVRQDQSWFGRQMAHDAIRLSDYGVKPRYPVPSFVATADQAKAAIAAAERVLDWADARWRVGPGG